MEIIKKQIIIPKNVQTVITAVCDYFYVSEQDVLSKTRRGEVVRCRQIAMLLCLRHLSMPQIQVGRYFNRDHSTVVHAKKTIEGFNSYDVLFKRKFDKVDNVVANRLLSLSIGDLPIHASIL